MQQSDTLYTRLADGYVCFLSVASWNSNVYFVACNTVSRARYSFETDDNWLYGWYELLSSTCKWYSDMLLGF